MVHHSPIRKHPSPQSSAIPDKLYFRIGDVARLCEVPAYVLRFWESEFPQLKPNKGGTGQRLYRRRDVEMALRIKCLLYDEGYTIPGARQLLKGEQKQKEAQLSLVAEPQPSTRMEQLQGLRNAMAELLEIVSGPPYRAKPEPVRRQRTVPASERDTEQLFPFGAVHDETKGKKTHE